MKDVYSTKIERFLSFNVESHSDLSHFYFKDYYKGEKTYQSGDNPCRLTIFHFADRWELLGVNWTSLSLDPEKSVKSDTVINVFLLSKKKNSSYQIWHKIYLVLLLCLTYFF